eukprot:5255067-Pyramimonas_sp.AAC.1
MSPVTRGFPSVRERRYTYLFKKSAVLFLGSSQEFESMFNKERVLPGSIYYSDSDENVREEFEELAGRRKLNPICMSHKMDW